MRDHSRHELHTKLLRWLERDAREASRRSPASAGGQTVDRDDAQALERVDTLLDALTAAGHLDESRFVESRVRTRAPRFGDRRIQAEIRRHGLDAGTVAIESLAGAELGRAHQVWLRKFGPLPSSDRLEQARQARFLAARGFSTTTIRNVIRGKIPETDDAS